MRETQYTLQPGCGQEFHNHAGECVGTGRMGLALHREYFEQLRLVQEEIGFSHIRGHGLFCDDMAIYQEYRDANGETHAEYNFTYLDRVMDSYREHYTQYEALVKNQVQENNAAVDEKLKSLKSLARKIRKTSDSMDSRIDQEVQRLSEALSNSIEGSIKQSCDEELKKLSEATHVLHDYSEKVKEQYEKLQKLEGFKFALFTISSLCSPIILILMILNLLHII